jgi:hypothetical protein
MSKRNGFQRLMGVILLGMLLALSTGTAIGATNSGVHINEVLFNPGTGVHQWVELKNSGATPVNIGGYRVSNEAGAWYTIPTALPAVPVGAFVVVVFDGAGSGDDYDFSDNVATLHTGAGVVDILGRTTGQCALYVAGGEAQVFLPAVLNAYNSFNPPVPAPPSAFPEPAIVSFVAWGAAPADRAANASKAGLWTPEWYKSLARGLGLPGEPAIPNQSIGILPGSQTAYPDDWTLYNEVTKGGENPVPGISFYYPLSGATMEDKAFSIGWSPVRGATYHFQMATNSTFTSLVVNNPTLPVAVYIPSTPLGIQAPGTYYWRVKVLLAGRESPWSNGSKVISETLPALVSTEGLLGAPSQKKYILPRIAWQLQHKDTPMLCLEGCLLTETAAEGAWDKPHTTRGTHGDKYCVPASMSMLLSYYGGKVSQDRLMYNMGKGAAPEGELRHNKTPPSWQSIYDALIWSLGIAGPIAWQQGKPTFAQIKNWVDANQPSITVFENPGGGSSHARVMDGYFEAGTHQKIHILDPWTRDTGAGKDFGWVNYADDNIISYWVGPAGAAGAPNVQSDEPSIWETRGVTGKDSDGDGIIDFDETKRFKTDPNLKDTDGDRVPDKEEIRSYVFNDTGAFSRRDADKDGDTKRKELDPDNDNADNRGLDDGCEDTNFNGIYEPLLGETDPFNPLDDKSLLITLTWPAPGTDVDLHLVNPSGGVCYYSNQNPDWGVTDIKCDDPVLDVDCIDQCTVEHITLNKLENGAYTVKVHYYSDHNLGPTSPSVTVWLQGASYSFGPQTLADGDTWDVCTINWPSKTVGSGGAVTPLSNSQRLRRPKK